MFQSVHHHGCSVGGGGKRTDKYLVDADQLELGIKQREGKPGYEVKGLVTVVWGTLSREPLAGRIELWTKWTSKPLVIDEKALVPITKIRWLRKFDTKGVDPAEVPLNEKEEPIRKLRGACLPLWVVTLSSLASLMELVRFGGRLGSKPSEISARLKTIWVR